MERVRAQGDLRPMAGNAEAMADLERILATRDALYQRADVTLSTSGRRVEESLDELLRAVALPASSSSVSGKATRSAD
jgi:XRE family aerobic/anaerobic benzoate catabolism transcriptional regulator